MSSFLLHLAAARAYNISLGIYSVCCAHPLVIKAAVQQAVADDNHLLIEATCNQVNQFGGYTGMRPDEFVSFVREIADRFGLERRKLILGGDHLGPNPWRHLPALEAMEHALAMVTEYARAGFTKIHLDASMCCADDPYPLDEYVIASRAAQLCAAAETAACGRRICYIIGTEVPAPGGATESLQMEVTCAQNVRRTRDIHREAFRNAGLDPVWPRVIAMVVQPGVEFNHDSVLHYDPRKTAELQQLLHDEPGLIYEAHSTDYQRPAAYRELIHDGFAILKVGPALTFALREGLFALATLEQEIITSGIRSEMRNVLEKIMLEKPIHWNHHYRGDARGQYILRQYSYSDRIRYYWTDPEVQNAVQTLLSNLKEVVIPQTMLSQYLPEQYAAIRAGELEVGIEVEQLLIHKIRKVLEPYAEACRIQNNNVPAIHIH